MIAVFVEGRVGGDEMRRLAVHAAQELQVVAVKERAVFEVGLGHGMPPFRADIVSIESIPLAQWQV